MNRFNFFSHTSRLRATKWQAFGHFYSPNSQNSFFAKNSTRFYATYRRFNGQQTVSGLNVLNNTGSRKLIGGTIVIGGIIYFSNLEEAPVSGRRRFIWTSESIERKIGDYSYRQLLGQFRGKLLADNHPQVLKVKSIFQRILNVSPIDESKLDWKVHVIYDPHSPPNAFVLPGGKVFVFSSIIPICKNDDGMATVLSHEFAHQLARHTGENMSKTPIYAALSLLLYTLTGADMFNNLIMNALVKMPASREMETEADYIGLMLMSQACFDPREAPHVWERMTQFEKTAVGRSVPEFLSTHPASTRRIQNMEEWLPKALEARANSNCRDYNGFMALSHDLW
ncbi:CYFA0S01e08922g1_1 [Cyberlindnera fabianii]|uniref:CYFA0S01e08922g1_1 n=1 Tax=Cyberlindnera fabianii TaxID=36022 RepID=A0A061ARA0_CYBFA|nr:Mitochondrial metalloendopeptidase OMA1 [Cyberlindnera fabianii]CDR37252.1 CYFA0S01e08922g1_1 [Cyberlindnera fabianii]